MERIEGKKMLGYDFHRQKPLDNYIVDFSCNELYLVIEIDGSRHSEEKFEYDEQRQKKLESFGLTFLRFEDRTIRNHLDEVIEYIKEWINTTHPSLL